VVVAWHLFDAPRTPAAFAAALPLAGLDAWRIYPAVPYGASRLPPGGLDEIQRMAAEDVVALVFDHAIGQAVAEFPAFFESLRSRFGFASAPSALIGGSVGGAIACAVACSSSHDLDALVLVNAMVQLRAGVDATGQAMGMTYPWATAQSLASAARFDFVARSEEIAARGAPAVLCVVGEDDSVDGFREPSIGLVAALERLGVHSELVLVPGLAHPLTEEPGVEPAPQNAQAASVDGHATRWLEHHLR
jgi:pimeloyl-ACP methyl ester carboxylesterase